MTLLPVWLTGTVHPPTSSSVWGVYCGICGHSHDHPLCTPSLWSRLKFWWQYSTDPSFRRYLRQGRELSSVLTGEIKREINREIIEALFHNK